MAFDTDPERKGCYYEPSLEVRNLALEALNLCPKKEQKDDSGGQSVIERGEDTTGGGGVIESGKDDGGIKLDETGGDSKKLDEPKKPTPDDTDAGDSTTFQDSGSAFKSASYRISNERLLDARITQFYNEGYLIEFVGEYLIPDGQLLYITVPNGSAQIVEVQDSEVGFARVSPVEGKLSNHRDSQIYVGIIE